VRTLQRWTSEGGVLRDDGRPGAMRPKPSHALTAEERVKMLQIANDARFAALPPARIVPMLAGEGVYLASESTFARILRDQGQSVRRGREKPPTHSRPPSTYIASGPRQVWCWDMTYLPATTTGRWFHLYLILDLYSRKIVGWEVHGTDAAEHGFPDLEASRQWARRFVDWYNVEHRHSGIRYVSPTQRHDGEDHAILAARDAVYAAARARHPTRWSGPTRDWSPIGAVTLNPERDAVIAAAAGEANRMSLAA
jgi:transposase InsO family protein